MRHRDATEARQPDPYGVAVGDLIAGTDVTYHASRVGVVMEIVPFAAIGNRPTCNRYHVRCGELYATGNPVECVLFDHPRVVVPAGDPVHCANCGGKHDGADRFIECQIAHLRAEAVRNAQVPA